MMRTLRFCMLAMALLVAGSAYAAQTLDGGTGLLTVPTAETLGRGDLNLAVDYVNYDASAIAIRAGYGIMDGLELGVMYTLVDSEGVDSLMGANVKYALPVQLAEGLKLAVGGGYGLTNTDGDDLSQFIVYGAATYALKLEGINLLATAGLNFESLDFGDQSESGIGFAAGLEVGVMEGLAVVAEFSSDHGDLEDGTTGIAVRYALPMVQGLTVEAGLTDGGEDYELLFGAQYLLSFGK